MMDTTAEYKMTKLGKIPNDWDIKPLSQLASDNKPHTFIDGDWIESKDMAEEGIRIIQTGNIGIGKFIEKKSKRYISQQTFEELNCKEIYQGDILICRLADPIGRACLVPDKKDRLITSVDVTIFRPSEEYDSKYLVYYINSDENLSEINKYTSGTTRQRISRGNLANVAIKIPPLEEQQKIAEILSTVDEQIEQTDQLIEKTKELKKGLTQQLLIKGIGHTKFKQSEIGEIPVEWEVKQLEEIADVKGGKRLPKGKSLVKENTGFSYIRVSDMEGGCVSLNNIQYVPKEVAPKISNYRIYAGELFISVAGTLGIVGDVPVQLDGANLTENANRICNITINRLYLKYLLTSSLIQNEIDKVKTTSAQPKLALTRIKKFLITVPSLIEQQKIAEILSSVDEDIQGYEEEKSKYEKLKTGLMQQLLTGKRRVKV